MNFTEINSSILPPDRAAMDRSISRWNSSYKPIDGLGYLETIITRIAGMTGSEKVTLSHPVCVPMCADNGVVAEGVSQSGSEITAVVAANMGKGISSVCVMGKIAGVMVVPVDVGIRDAEELPGVISRKLMHGTANMAKGPAMTRETALKAVNVGIELAGDLKNRGCDLLISGEMGIGNTTTSAAVASVLLGLSPEHMTGKGAGLPEQGLLRKIEVIRNSIYINRPDSEDVLDTLSKVGGLDIAAMAGLFIGGALQRIPVLVDGVISLVAALTAVRLCPACREYMIATHASAEPAARIILEELRLRPVIDASLRLGEGTGAVCLVPMLRMALAIYDGETFESQQQTAYIDYDADSV